MLLCVCSTLLLALATIEVNAPSLIHLAITPFAQPGILGHPSNQIEGSWKELEHALKTYRELAQKDPENYLPRVAAALDELATLDSDQNRFEEARQEDG